MPREARHHLQIAFRLRESTTNITVIIIGWQSFNNRAGSYVKSQLNLQMTSAPVVATLVIKWVLLRPHSTERLDSNKRCREMSLNHDKFNYYHTCPIIEGERFGVSTFNICCFTLSLNPTSSMYAPLKQHLLNKLQYNFNKKLPSLDSSSNLHAKRIVSTRGSASRR